MTVGVATVAVANAILDALRNTSFAVAATYVQLHTGDPGASGTANVSTGSTTRNQLTLAAASGGSAASSALAAWTNGGATETVSHISVWTAASAGTFLLSGTLTASQAWVSTNTLTLTVTVSVTPLAA